MKTRIEVITPEMAAVLLERNMNNRRKNPNTISRYADDMTHGRWKLNGESIKITNTRLLDGQHRLEACVKSGVSFTSLVVELPDDTAFDTIDQGDKRTAAAVLGIGGHKNAALTAGAVRWIEAIRASDGRTSFAWSHAQRVCSSPMIREFIDRHPEIDESVAVSRRAYKACRALVPSMLAGLHFLFAEKAGKTIADDFIERLGTGEGLSAGSPILTLRNRMIERSLKLHKEDTSWMGVLHIYAWNNYRKGKSMHRTVRFENDPIPHIL